MASRIDIINLALANLSNQNFIQDEGEQNSEAIQASRHWSVVLDSVLSEYAWSFACHAEPLALLDDDTAYSGWAYHYAYPAGCVAIRKVFAAGGNRDPEPFRVGLARGGALQAVMTNVEDAVAEYTVNTVPVSQFPPQFANALAWRLSAEIALAQRADPSLFDACLKGYMAQVDLAKLRDAQERGPVAKRPGSWIRSRHG